MSISQKGKLRILSYCLYILFFVIDAYLLFEGILSWNQSFTLLFGLMGAFGVIDLMLKINEDSILIRNRIIIATTLSPAIILLTILLLFSPIDSNISVITIAVVGLSITLTISAIDWKAKRKAKADNIQSTIKN
jgi:hypothetical protein